jgi:leucine dehydrogenase
MTAGRGNREEGRGETDRLPSSLFPFPLFSNGVLVDIFDAMRSYGHEQLLLSHDPSCGYYGIIAIHDTTLGPALGGTRFWQYRDTDEAITDALRLARGMTYKSAVAGINLGGGKSVIIGDNRRQDREALFRAHGRFVETLNGRYITAEDIGTTPADMEYIKLETDHVAGLLGLSGDPSPVTAYGVYVGMKAAAKTCWGGDSLEGRTVAVQGVGNVAYHLCRHLHDEGVRLLVTDIRAEKVQRVVDEMGAMPVAADAIYDQQADIYAPCALGATINDETIPRLKAKVVAGAANNILAEDRHGDELIARGIVFAVDYIANSGGTIFDTDRYRKGGFQPERAMANVRRVGDRMREVFAIADRDGIAYHRAADRLAEQRIAALDAVRLLDRPDTVHR